MGMKYSDERSFNDGEWTHSIRSLSKFQTSWDWLMPVVEKIKNIAVKDENIEVFYEVANHIPDRHETYNAVVEFINQYNNLDLSK